MHVSLSRRFNISALVLFFLGKIYERYYSTFSKNILCKIFKNPTFSQYYEEKIV